MGESLLGIEVPNPSPSIVSLKRVMKSKSFRLLNKKSMLPVALGRGSDGDEVVFDLTRMPHLLIAGATGSGKSVCMNAIISCLIMERTPAELQMLLIDPKRVELTPYNGVPHLITPVVVETDRVVNLLKGLTREMMDRYRTMEEVGVRNIEAHNQIRPRDKMPYIVVAIDELADLMMTAAFDVEQSICRLAQLGRATGIHLIIATQRPSVDVITGLIKANFPSRISFGVTSQVDSRTILDATGAERLLGRGDMLYQPIDGTRPTRVQSVFISDEEIYGIVTHWKDIPWAARVQIELHNPGEEIIDKSVIGSTNNTNNQDELVDRAIELAQRHSKLSTSLLQRRLRIGYPRAARLMDELEDMGIVSTSDGSKSRDVIIR
jgi:S-DNA-T family DNA segregation ATPase FtsK/SpoIIIE